ncbi:hypothetical protein B0H14DRAFT_3608646 [Mycena olivaceomarginata]|nr:hypothetical protein B0H14DRAFT_3608646 [Mycena olivaceomarginata]
MASKHTPDDQKLIDTLPLGVVMAFRSSIFNPSYIINNPHRFITNDWIDASQLRDFLHHTSNSTPQPSISLPAHVKLENDAVDAVLTVKTRTLKEAGREVLEILSDSEPETALPLPSSGPRSDDSSNFRESSPLPPSDFPSEASYTESDGYLSSDEHAGTVPDLEVSDTLWADPEILSFVRIGDLRCSAIVHPTTGLKRKHCPHAHIVDGMAVVGRVVHRGCFAERTIYVPIDPTLKKASFELKEAYRQCVRMAGTVGATVSKVDNAPSTQILLGGRPSEAGAALQDQRLKQKIVRGVKRRSIQRVSALKARAFKLFWDEMKKPVNEKYIHRLVTMPDGGVMILTCLAALMKLLDDTGVTSFETDTTFRRIAVTVTIARGYVNGASAAFFERLFDEFQAVKLEITKKPVAFKRFVEGGNIIAMNSDMEAAQVLGAARSFFKTNDAEYSGLPENTPGEEVAPEMIKLCTTHAKR